MGMYALWMNENDSGGWVAGGVLWTPFTTEFPLLWNQVADFHEILIKNGILVIIYNAVLCKVRETS